MGRAGKTASRLDGESKRSRFSGLCVLLGHECQASVVGWQMFMSRRRLVGQSSVFSNNKVPRTAAGPLLHQGSITLHPS